MNSQEERPMLNHALLPFTKTSINYQILSISYKMHWYDSNVFNVLLMPSDCHITLIPCSLLDLSLMTDIGLAESRGNDSGT